LQGVGEKKKTQQLTPGKLKGTGNELGKKETKKRWGGPGLYEKKNNDP